jgi:hypothetical protein
MKTTSILSLLGIIGGFLTGCQKEEVPVYSGNNYIQFVKNLTTDSTTVAFLNAPGATQLDSMLIVKMTGSPYRQEKAYRISVDTRFTTAVEGTHFSLPERTVFKPGQMRDTLAITFYRTADMKTQTYRLVLRVEPNEIFQLGQLQYQYKVFLVHDNISRPTWWTDAVSTSYLGPYSDLKYQYFIDATGVADLTGATSSDLRINALKLKYWLEEQKALNDGEPVREANGDEMKVSING